ncbi:hypothetical protein [Lacipirellula sp.]|uniref:hypothetical protein n=1 Tax=Lacipirellula sp. TaxID=2691419 RepID=UPI003D0BB2D5
MNPRRSFGVCAFITMAAMSGCNKAATGLELPVREVALQRQLPMAVVLDQTATGRVFATSIPVGDPADLAGRVLRISQGEIKSAAIEGGIPFSIDTSPVVDGRMRLAVGVGGVERPLDFNYSSNEPTVFQPLGRISIVDGDTLAQLDEIETQWSVIEVAFSPDGTQLVAVGASGVRQLFVGFWSWPSLEKLSEHSCAAGLPQFPFRSPVKVSAFASSGSNLLVSIRMSELLPPSHAKANGGLLVLECKSGKQVGSVKIDRVCTFLDHSDRTSLLTCASESNCSLFKLDLANCATQEFETRLLNTHYGALVPFEAEDRLLAVKHEVGSGSRRVANVDVLVRTRRDPDNNIWQTQETLFDESIQHRNICLSMSGEEREFALGTSDGRVIVWKVD